MIIFYLSIYLNTNNNIQNVLHDLHYILGILDIIVDIFTYSITGAKTITIINFQNDCFKRERVINISVPNTKA